MWRCFNWHLLHFSGGLRGASIIDSLDTLYIMGLMDEYNDAKEWVKTSLDLNSVRKIFFSPSFLQYYCGLDQVWRQWLTHTLCCTGSSTLMQPFSFLLLSNLHLVYPWDGSHSCSRWSALPYGSKWLVTLGGTAAVGCGRPQWRSRAAATAEAAALSGCPQTSSEFDSLWSFSN